MSKIHTNTSWNKVAKWYNKIVDLKGHYFHEHIVIPNSLKLLNLKEGNRIFDLACGQGILGRSIPNGINYTGIDISADLIQYARKLDQNKNHRYIQADVTRQLPVNEKDFTHSTIILALQNIEDQKEAIQNTARYLVPNGKFLIVINHPCFRIPRQSSWGIDEQNKLEYRRINIYMTPLKIPIDMYPGQFKKILTWTFHRPISFYSDILLQSGFVIEKIEEWVSDKKSVGKAGKMENRTRSEIPLFMAILARKEKHGDIR